MKVQKIVLGSLCVALVGSSIVFAGEGEKERKGRKHDGQRGAAHFKAMDTDGDGKITLSEFTVMHEQRVAKMKERLGDKWDPERAAKHPGAAEIFEKMDADGDKSLTKAEMKEARKRMHERHGKRHGKGKGEGEGKGKEACPKQAGEAVDVAI